MEGSHTFVNPLLLRVRRYIREIKDAVDKISSEDQIELLESSFDQYFHSKVRYRIQDLIPVEEKTSPLNLYKHLLFAYQKIESLETEKEYLLESHKNAQRVPELQKLNESLELQKKDLAQSLEELERKKNASETSHMQRYDELHRVFNELSEQANISILECERLKTELQSSQTERDALHQKLESLESHYKETLEQSKKAHNEDLTKLRDLNDAFMEEKRQFQAKRNEFKTAEANMKEYIENQREEIKMLLDKNSELEYQLHEKMKEQEKQVSTKTNTSANSDEDNDREKMQVLEAKLFATQTEVSKYRSKLAQYRNQQLNSHEIESQVKRWEEAASILAREKANVSVTPTQLKQFLFSIDSWKRQLSEEILAHRQNETELLCEINRIRDELKAIGLENYTLRKQCQSAEKEASMTAGSLKAHKALFERLYKDLNDPSHDQLAIQKNLVDISAYVNELRADREKFVEVLKQYQDTFKELADEKQENVEKARSAQAKFKELELLYESVKIENSESVALLEQQKILINQLKSKINSIESSSLNEKLKILKNEKDEVSKLSEMMRRYYQDEAIIFRAIIKALFGWKITIDMAPPGKDITVTLRPGIDNSSLENSDSAFIFRVKSKQLSVNLDKVPTAVIEEEINRLYTDADFILHLDGRYAEQWENDENWKNQLTARCSYAGFLAITILGEQNQLLQKQTMLHVLKSRKTKESNQNQISDEETVVQN